MTEHPGKYLNNARNGTGITRLVLGELPLTMRRQCQNARKYRRNLESLIVDVKGTVNVTDAHLVDEAAAAEVHASICRWLLRTRLEKMSISDIARCSEQILRSKSIRNKAVERLGLSRDRYQDAIDPLYREPEKESAK